MKRSQSSKNNTVNIATLKAKLAHYLRVVKSGEQVIILDHKMPVAKIIPMEESGNRLLSTKPQGSFSNFVNMKVPAFDKKPKVSILTILLEDRAKR